MSRSRLPSMRRSHDCDVNAAGTFAPHRRIDCTISKLPREQQLLCSMLSFQTGAGTPMYIVT